MKKSNGPLVTSETQNQELTVSREPAVEFAARRQGHDLVTLAIDESDCNLNADDPVFAGEIDRFLRMLKIESVDRIRRPIS